MPEITGYRNLSSQEVDIINAWKDLELTVNHKMQDAKREGADGRLCALAATHFETAFMFVIKAIAKPE